MQISKNFQLVTNYGSAKIKKIAVRAEERILPPPRVAIDVKTGDQSGSAAILEQHEFTVGSDLSDDLFLWNPEEPEGKVFISAANAAVGTIVSVSTTASDIRLNGNLVGQTPQVEKLPCKLNFGKNEIVLFGKTLDIEHKSDKSLQLHLLLAITCVLFLGLLSFQWINGRSDLTNVNSPKLNTEDFSVSSPQANLAAIATISETALAEKINVAAGNDGVIIVSGKVPPSLASDWQMLRSNLDEVLSNQAILFDIEFTNDLNSFPAIALASLEPEKFLVLVDGKKVSLQAELIDNWHLVDVTKDEAILERDGEITSIQWGTVNDQN